MSQELQNQIRALIEPEFTKRNLYLVDVNLRGQTNSHVLTVLADTDKGISLDELADVARAIDEILEVHDPIRGKYRLEISSPGVNFPLTEKWQYQKNIGRDLLIQYKDDDIVRDLQARLLKIDEDALHLKVKKEEITISLADIVSAKVKPKW